MHATYEAVDLASLTTEFASTFRSACEKAGVRLSVNCEPIDEPVFVDRDMWEKIVLNLLSNAFKFTFEGEISVRLSRVENGVELQVSDTGTGIPESEMPRLFERFHRIHGARGRSVEGTGIGLAMVQELVKLHGGTVRAESVVGRGTTFHVRVPFGSASQRLPTPASDRTSGLAMRQLAEEASQWLDTDVRTEAQSLAPRADRMASEQPRRHILLADDNADLRAYVSRLLRPVYDVTAVADGEQALRTALELRPDLVLADIMMPKLDGIELVRALRAEPALAGVPVVLLSARAGEEAKIEGLDTGADDYLVKPFSSRELLARIRSQLTLSQAREQVGHERESGRERVRIAQSFAEVQRQDFHTLLMQAPNPFTILRGREFRIELVNPALCRIWGRTPGGCHRSASVRGSARTSRTGL